MTKQNRELALDEFAYALTQIRRGDITPSAFRDAMNRAGRACGPDAVASMVYCTFHEERADSEI